MPAKNIYHDAVVHALTADGWTVTAVLAETDPDRLLHLAVPRRIYEGLLAGPFGQLIVTRLQLRLLVFDEQQDKVVKWIS